MHTVIDAPMNRPVVAYTSRALPETPRLLDASALGLDARVRCHEREPGQAPLFIECADDGLRDRAAFRAWFAQVRPIIDALIVRHGTVVLRGFPIAETDDFAALVAEFPKFTGDYAGGRAPRSAVKGDVMEATRLEASVQLALHSEMAYMRDYPRRLAFFARRIAARGGETTIGDMRTLVAGLPQAAVAKLHAHKTRMATNYGPKSDALQPTYAHMDLRGWNHAFFTDDPQDVERLCAHKGLTPIWNPDGSLTLLTPLDPFVSHPQTGQLLYRSVIHMRPQSQSDALSRQIRATQQHPTGATLGTGESLSAEELHQIDTACAARTVHWRWQAGDVMLVDNLQVWHGRNPYEGERETQVALLN
ncbi:TauD/TfdA family dioxygenase [Comamonas serinivorans]|nr:TauD/TfdA family dioxygenase [Comamonas serinivorans]